MHLFDFGGKVKRNVRGYGGRGGQQGDRRLGTRVVLRVREELRRCGKYMTCESVEREPFQKQRRDAKNG